MTDPGSSAPRAASVDREALREQVFRDVESMTGVGAWTWDPIAGASSWSDQTYKILGLDPEQTPLTYEAYLSLVPAGEREQLMATVQSGLRNGMGYVTDHRIIRPDGSVRELHCRGRGAVDQTGALTYAIGTIADVTDLRATARELAQARDLFAGVLDAATEQSIIGLDPRGIITVFNAGAERMLGYTAAEIVGLTGPELLHDPVEVAARAAELGVAADFHAIIGRAAKGIPETRRWTNVTKDGKRLQVQITSTAMRDDDGVISGFIKVGTDITARVNAESALQASEELFERIFDRAPIGIVLLDSSDPTNGRTLRVNPALCSITGYSEDQLLAMPIQKLIHPDHMSISRQLVEELNDGRVASTESERRWVHADGRDIWVHTNVSPVVYHGVQFLIGMIEDITARKAAEDRLSHLALHDALTGLPNRMLLMDRLEHAIAAAGRSHTMTAVLYLDLDGFKSVNDEAGHLAGDDILTTVAKRLTDHLRPGDTVARIGGDEFVVLCTDLTDEADAHKLANRVRRLLAEPYARGRDVHHLSASIGVAVSTELSTAQNLIREADDAMYVAKDNGKNRVYRSGSQDPQSLNRSARAARHQLVEAELRSALERGELVMYGQPVLDLPSRSIIGIETLIRWQHPARGLLPPAEFLDVAETSPLIVPIGQRVLAESCRIAAELASAAAGQHSSAPVMYVNISGRQLESGSLHEDVLHALDAAGLRADRLVLELTETVTPLIAGSLLDDLDDLRRRGVRLAIDDVGTGYSSLSRLTELPVDILKIDRSFTARIGQNAAVDAVVRAILSIGESLSIQVVAEGVETAEQELQLRDLGCFTVQGFRYSEPRPEADLHRLLRAPGSVLGRVAG